MEKRKHVDDLQLGFRVESFKDFICLAGSTWIEMW